MRKYVSRTIWFFLALIALSLTGPSLNDENRFELDAMDRTLATARILAKAQQRQTEISRLRLELEETDKAVKDIINKKPLQP